MSRKSLFRVLLLMIGCLLITVFAAQIVGVAVYSRMHQGHIGTWDKDSPLSNLVTSVFAIVASILSGFTYLVAKKTDSRSQNHRLLDLFMKFEDEHFRKVRDNAWEARSKWYLLEGDSGDEWRRTLIGGTVPSTPELGIPPVREPKVGEHPPYHGDERWAVFQMLNLYEALAFFECDHEKLGRIGLYYPYWRGFLLEVISAYEQSWERDLTAEQKLMLPREEWKEAFEKLDERFKLPRYIREHDPQLRRFYPPQTVNPAVPTDSRQLP